MKRKLKKIIVKPNPIIRNGNYDFSEVSKEELLNSSQHHINDVRQGITWFIEELVERGQKHDFTKLKYINEYYQAFLNDLKIQDWGEFHKKMQRHHIDDPNGQPQDIDLIDVIEFIIDTVMAGVAKYGQYNIKLLSDDLLQKAYKNTIKKLLDITERE